MKNADLSSDRAGQIQAWQRPRRPDSKPRPSSTPPEFRPDARQGALPRRSRNEFGRAILVAPPAFMGMLNATLDRPTAQMVTDRLEKDYTKSSEPDLCGRLETCIIV
jgi:protein required for attachment to host cells